MWLRMFLDVINKLAKYFNKMLSRNNVIHQVELFIYCAALCKVTHKIQLYKLNHVLNDNSPETLTLNKVLLITVQKNAVYCRTYFFFSRIFFFNNKRVLFVHNKFLTYFSFR